MSDAQEKVFYEHGEVKVTNSRFIVPSQTYAISGITSVKFFTEKPSRLWPLLFIFGGLIALVNHGNIWAVGIPFAIGILLFLRKPKYHVVLSSASGETRALQSQNRDFISSVITGLNDAIIART